MAAEKCSSYKEDVGKKKENTVRVESILISKCNQYGTYQGSYEVNWTKKSLFHSEALKPQGNRDSKKDWD